MTCEGGTEQTSPHRLASTAVLDPALLPRRTRSRDVRYAGIEPASRPWQGRVVPTDSYHMLQACYQITPGAPLWERADLNGSSCSCDGRDSNPRTPGSQPDAARLTLLPSPSQHQESNPALPLTKRACNLLHLAGVCRSRPRLRVVSPRGFEPRCDG